MGQISAARDYGAAITYSDRIMCALLMVMAEAFKLVQVATTIATTKFAAFPVVEELFHSEKANATGSDAIANVLMC